MLWNNRKNTLFYFLSVCLSGMRTGPASPRWRSAWGPSTTPSPRRALRRSLNLSNSDPDLCPLTYVPWRPLPISCSPYQLANHLQPMGLKQFSALNSWLNCIFYNSWIVFLAWDNKLQSGLFNQSSFLEYKGKNPPMLLSRLLRICMMQVLLCKVYAPHNLFFST